MENLDRAQLSVENNDEIEIDLREVFHVLWRKLWALILFLVVGACIAGAATMLMTPQYQATSTIYMFSKETDLSSLTSLQIGSQLTADYEKLATSRPVVEKVIQQLGLDMTYEDFVSMIQINNPTDTHMLTVTVTSTDPQQAANISNTLANALSDRVEEVIDTDRPNMVEEAVVPQNASSPSLKKNVVIGAVLGFVLVAAVILVQYFLDDTIQTEEDVTKYLGLNTLASIPAERGSHHKQDKQRKKEALKKQRSSGTATGGHSSASPSGRGGKRQGSRESR